MFGSYIVFAIVVVIVSVYMTIVHSFLRSAEEPQDEIREQRPNERKASRDTASGNPRPQYAH
jgi:hypothetical protein